MNAIYEQDTNIKALLQAHIGEHAHPVEFVSKATGISERQIRSHLSRDGSKPNSDHILAYMRALPPSFYNAYLGGAGLQAFKSEPTSGCHLTLVNASSHAAARFLTVNTKAALDSVIDHRERMMLPAVYRNTGTRFLSVAHALEN